MDDENIKFAVLITCYNRKEKTLNCLNTLYQSVYPDNYSFEVFLVDDGSTDGTSIAIKERYPQVNVIQGNGSLFWAGGMRLAWRTALQSNEYDAFLLLNDDVDLKADFFKNIIATEIFALKKYGKKGLYSCSTSHNKDNDEITYGGHVVVKYHLNLKIKKIIPKEIPLECDLTNANILWVDKEVVEKCGIFDTMYTHGIADFDYSLHVKKMNFPVLITPNIGGYCLNDHKLNWLPASKSTVKDRVKYLKSNKGISQKEYLYYVYKHFPFHYPMAFIMQWLKVLFPFLWDYKYKHLLNTL